MIKKLNLLGGTVAVLFYVSAIGVFLLRLAGMSEFTRWLGYFEFLLALPLIYLLIKAPQAERPPLYYVQIGLILAWLAVELVLDYILMLDFRQAFWMVIIYVVLFFAGSGGLLGVATLAGKKWKIAAVVLFLIMAVLAFVQREVTGM